MRRLIPFLLLASFALPCAAFAQESSDEEAVASEEGADEQATEDGAGYEPDQRGAEGGDEPLGGEATGGDQASGDDDGYEPDQRGAEEQPEADTGTGPDRAQVLSTEEAAYGRGGIGVELYLWLGAGATGLDAIEGDNLLLPAQSGSLGGTFGLTLGVRLGPLTIGPRLNVSIESSIVLNTFGVDAIFALMQGSLVPTVRVGLSYALVLPTADALPSQNPAQGLLAELGIGIRGPIGGDFFLGGEASAGYLGLFRTEVPACEEPCTDSLEFDLRRPGSAHGLTARLHLFVGVGF